MTKNKQEYYAYDDKELQQLLDKLGRETKAEIQRYNTGLEIKKTPSGKPFFADRDGNAADIYFSLSHSGDIAACAIGNVPCGIDVETKPIPERVMKRFFPDCTDNNEALVLWTRRESAGKLDGRGFFADPDPTVSFRTFVADGFTLTACVKDSERILLF